MEARVQNKIQQVQDQIAAMEQMISDPENRPGEFDFLIPEVAKAKKRLARLQEYLQPVVVVRIVEITPSGSAAEHMVKTEDMLATTWGLIGGDIHQIALDDGTIMVIDRNGMARGLWPNHRATAYLHRHSEKARDENTQVLGAVILWGKHNQGGGFGSFTVPVAMV